MKYGVKSGIPLKCMTCGKTVDTLVVNGETIYPNRPELKDLVFLQCPHCGNYVGADALRPEDSFLSWRKRHENKVIPSPEFRKIRQRIHALMDELWQKGVISRGELYRQLSRATGTKFHASSLHDIKTAQIVYTEVNKIRRVLLRK